MNQNRNRIEGYSIEEYATKSKGESKEIRELDLYITENYEDITGDWYQKLELVKRKLRQIPSGKLKIAYKMKGREVNELISFICTEMKMSQY